jgi:hypothetical protein
MYKFIEGQLIKIKKGIEDTQNLLKKEDSVNYHQFPIDIAFSKSTSILIASCDFCIYIERTGTPCGGIWNKLDNLARDLTVIQRDLKENNLGVYYKQYNLDPEINKIINKIDVVLKYISTH